MSTAIVRQAKVESWEDHVEAWHHLSRRVDDAAWDKAAIAVSVTKKHGEASLTAFGIEVGVKERMMRYLAATFRAFPEIGNRLPNLSFTHHLIAVESTDTIEEARAALALAEEGSEGKRWSVSSLRAYLNPPAEKERTTSPPADSCDTETGACGPLTRRDKTAHIAGLVESLHQSMRLFESVKSYNLDPLVEHGTKKSLRELVTKIDNVIEWLGTLKAAVRRRS